MRQKLLDYAVEILKRWTVGLKTLVVALFDFVGLTLIVIVLVPLVVIATIYFFLKRE